ncbi:MAG: tRNA (adenosine(37)-N6)-threonylcarbamoyltransferase complex ATPase subunit type 1 TsaE [Patescibacteria group bacterium]|nr:tRNA (adenosine(37)-N6)-threonylcarbamoyltransferase complex ATPase subunit type 1 TsaE [Patescibacteria group bacterium]
MKKIITHSEKQTLSLGKKIAKKLIGGEVLALNGELGSGKTVLIKGIAAGLGIKKHITSPTFVVMKIHNTDSHGKKHGLTQTGAKIPRKSVLSLHKSVYLCHIDAYRLSSGQDLINIGVKDWLAKPNTVTVIEWAERVKNILPKDTIVIKIKLCKKKNQRIINLMGIKI